MLDDNALGELVRSIENDLLGSEDLSDDPPEPTGGTLSTKTALVASTVVDATYAFVMPLTSKVQLLSDSAIATPHQVNRRIFKRARPSEAQLNDAPALEQSGAPTLDALEPWSGWDPTPIPNKLTRLHYRPLSDDIRAAFPSPDQRPLLRRLGAHNNAAFGKQRSYLSAVQDPKVLQYLVPTRMGGVDSRYERMYTPSLPSMHNTVVHPQVWDRLSTNTTLVSRPSVFHPNVWVLTSSDDPSEMRFRADVANEFTSMHVNEFVNDRELLTLALKTPTAVWVVSRLRIDDPVTDTPMLHRYTTQSVLALNVFLHGHNLHVHMRRLGGLTMFMACLSYQQAVMDRLQRAYAAHEISALSTTDQDEEMTLATAEQMMAEYQQADNSV